MAWINGPSSTNRRWLRFLILLVIGIFIIGGSFAVSAKMESLENQEMRDVTGGEGIGFTLKDFHVTGNQALELFEGDFSCCDGGLRLEDFNLHAPGSPSSGVTTGSLSDPITLDVGGSNNGVVVMKLPDNQSNMDKNTFLIGGQTDATSTNGIYFTDSGDGDFVNLGGLRVNDAQYAGGTRLSIGGTPNSDGGIRLGLALELNGNLDFNDPTGGGFAFNGIHGSANYSTSSDDSNSGDWSFSGPLRWADITAGRPLVVNFQASSGNGELMVEWNPEKVNPIAGTLAAEGSWFQGQYYGEVLLKNIEVRNLQIKYNSQTDPITHDLGGYSAPNF